MTVIGLNYFLLAELLKTLQPFSFSFFFFFFPQGYVYGKCVLFICVFLYIFLTASGLRLQYVDILDIHPILGWISLRSPLSVSDWGIYSKCDFDGIAALGSFLDNLLSSCYKYFSQSFIFLFLSIFVRISLSCVYHKATSVYLGYLPTQCM